MEHHNTPNQSIRLNTTEPPPRIEERLEPINGIVQPNVIPPVNRPGRVTNQLQFLQKTVIKAVMKHQYAWPFLQPVDTEQYNLPDYHRVITQPMDLGTIKMRLDNKYYWSGKECIEDFYTMIKNCYTYNRPGEDVAVMAQTLEKVFLLKLADMPRVEVVVDTSKSRNSIAGVSRTPGSASSRRRQRPPSRFSL